MGQPIPAQHPSVVLRSHFKLVKALLAIALAAVLALSVAVVILANDEDQVSGGTTSAKPIESINYGGFNSATGRPDAAPVVQQQTQTPQSINYGGFNSATGRPDAAPVVQQQTQNPGTRYDGGPEEGTRGATSLQPQTAPGARYDGGPEEGTRGPQQLQFRERAGGPTMIPQGPGAR